MLLIVHKWPESYSGGMKILIPTNFSPESVGLIDQTLAKIQNTRTPTEILLLNTFTVKETNPGLVISENDRLKKESILNLQKLKAETDLKIKNPFILVTIASHLGTLKNVIQQILIKEDFDELAILRDQSSDISGITKFLKEKSCSVFMP